MDQSKNRIVRIGTILRNICTVLSWILAALIAGLVIVEGTLYFRPDFAELVLNMAMNNSLFHTLNMIVDLNSMNMRFTTMIAGLIIILTLAVTLFYIRRFRDFCRKLVESEKPFTIEASKEMRRASYSMLVIIFYNIFAGIGLFFVTFLFSYLVEYGAYLQDMADQTNHIQEEMIYNFAEVTENKSGQTGKHVRRVAEYTRILAGAMGYSEHEADEIALASTMHDIGKLMIPSEILDKPGKLTDEEYAVIKTHTTYGGKLLDHVEGEIMTMGRTIALEHHERSDGKGYPKGLKNCEISPYGKIVAVADVYDALTSRRSYKDAWEEDRAYQEIVKGSGTQFDEKVVEAFKASYEQINAARLAYQDQ